MNDQRSEIDRAEAALRRGVCYGLMLGLVLWAVLIMLLVAIGMAG